MKIIVRELPKTDHSCKYVYIRFRGTQREYSSKPLKHSNVKRILVFSTVDIGIFLSLKNFSSVRIS